MTDSTHPWYGEGLRFACTGCGRCCTGAPGYTFVSVDEIVAMAAYLKLTVETFSARYIRRVGGRYSLLERPKNYDCIFLQGKQCQVYPVRPTQCQTFPFWPGVLESPEAWKQAAVECEGISDTASVVPLQEIKRQLKRQVESQTPKQQDKESKSTP